MTTDHSNRRLNLSSQQKQEVAAWYAAGDSTVVIAKRLGCAKPSVRKMLRKMGVVLRPRSSYNLNIPHEECLRIVERYQAGEHSTAIAASFGCYEESIRHILHRYGVKLRSISEAKRPSLATDEAIRQLYGQGLSQNAVGSKLGICKKTVHDALRKHGDSIRPHTYGNTPGLITRRYPLNESAFDVLTDDAAYWVGFLMADGCCTDASGYCAVRLTLAERDRQHVERFRDFLGSGNKIVTIVQKAGYGVGCASTSLAVYSKKLFDRLGELGVTPRKSFTATPHPSLVSNPHFWRGMVDGDGSISLSTIKRKPPRHPRTIETLSLCGSLSCVQEFRAFCRSIVGTNAKILPHKLSPIWLFTLQAKSARIVLRVLYPQNCLALERKLIAVEQCLIRQD